MLDIWIWDIETYPNTFTSCFINAETKECLVFEISDRKDERQGLFSFLRKLYKEKCSLVGFNSLSFDYPVLHYLLKNQDSSVYTLYRKAMSIIKASDDEKFAHLVKPSDVLIRQIDLYKIHHFDNKAKSTSLKMIEFNSRSDTIEDLPFPVGIDLTDKQKDVLIEYNKHDVLKTLDFFFASQKEIEFRKSMSEKYGKDFTNHSESKIGTDFFIMRLEEVNPSACYEMVGKRRVMRQTKRSSINLGECIFPYIKFEREEFKAVLNWFKSQTITETKGVFSDLLESDLGDVAKYAEMVVKKKKLLKEPSQSYIDKLMKDKPAGYVVKETLKSGKDSWYFCWKVAETLNVVVDGFRYDFGVGGIHGSLESKIVTSNDEFVVRDADVSSYYPNLSISNSVYPEHLGKGFCKIYKAIYDERLAHQKGTVENLAMKLVLNSSYGNSNNQYSPLYDPMFTMKITINGQLSLCMLAEQLLKIEGLELIQLNTDGLTVRYPRKHDDLYYKVCDWWQKLTQLELEFVEYSKMCIRDVNNYIAVYAGGDKVKRKGAYEYQGLGNHQNHSMLVVPMAAEAYLVHGKSVEDFIKNHKDKYDFMLRVKVPRSNRLVTIDEFGGETEEQKISRYYVSNNGVDLIKIMPPLAGGKTVKQWRDLKKDVIVETDTDTKHRAMEARVVKGSVEYIGEEFRPNEERRQFIEANYKVKLCNNIKQYDGDINYDYYIEQTNRLISLDQH